jgi:hypothetical protein
MIVWGYNYVSRTKDLRYATRDLTTYFIASRKSVLKFVAGYHQQIQQTLCSNRLSSTWLVMIKIHC